MRELVETALVLITGGFVIFGIIAFVNAETVVHEIAGLVSFCVAMLAALGLVALFVEEKRRPNDE